MKKLNKVVLLAASVALTTTAFASDNWTNGDGELVWKNGSDELCWQDNNWSADTAAVNCGKPVAVVTPTPVAPKPTPEPVAPQVSKVTLQADALFDFDKAVIKADGQQKLKELAQSVAAIDLETVVAVGHTDWTGPEAYNQKLSERRAASVRDYLVSLGIPADRIFIEGKGETQPVADNKTREGRALNRRVEIEVVGQQTRN